MVVRVRMPCKFNTDSGCPFWDNPFVDCWYVSVFDCEQACIKRGFQATL